MKDALLPVFGTMGNILLLTGYMPQIVKMIHSKTTGGSVSAWTLWLLGDGCFLAYSIIEADFYSSVLFGIFVLCNSTILALTVLYDKVPPKHRSTNKL